MTAAGGPALRTRSRSIDLNKAIEDQSREDFSELVASLRRNQERAQSDEAALKLFDWVNTVGSKERLLFYLDLDEAVTDDGLKLAFPRMGQSTSTETDGEVTACLQDSFATRDQQLFHLLNKNYLYAAPF